MQKISSNMNIIRMHRFYPFKKEKATAVFKVLKASFGACATLNVLTVKLFILFREKGVVIRLEII
jgi:hypothetical protein